MNWISVKDRLPDKYSRVLVTNGIGICIGKKQSGFTGDIFCDRNCYDGCPMGGGDEDTFTHWMPLPELPNELD